MKIALDNPTASHMVESYTPGCVTIGQRRYTTSLILSPEQTLTWAVDRPADLHRSDLLPIMALEPELLILGTGDIQVFPDPAVFAEFMRQRIGFEVMGNPAACRTYNVLLAEHRRVALALILPGATSHRPLQP